MSTQKPKMLIADDSEIALLLEESYSADFEVTVARDGADVQDQIERNRSFEICIMDIVMPLETEDSPDLEPETTGIRLIRSLIEHDLCRRFLVLTVRWDVKEEILALVAGKGACEFLTKQRADSAAIKAAVSRLLEEEPKGASHV